MQFNFLVANHRLTPLSGIAGGVVSQTNFQKHFGMWPNGIQNTAQVTAVSSNVVSVLQAGAFFGALGSAPISCKKSSRLLSIADD